MGLGMVISLLGGLGGPGLQQAVTGRWSSRPTRASPGDWSSSTSVRQQPQGREEVGVLVAVHMLRLTAGRILASGWDVPTSLEMSRRDPERRAPHPGRGIADLGAPSESLGECLRHRVARDIGIPAPCVQGTPQAVAILELGLLDALCPVGHDQRTVHPPSRVASGPKVDIRYRDRVTGPEAVAAAAKLIEAEREGWGWDGEDWIGTPAPAGRITATGRVRGGAVSLRAAARSGSSG